MYDVDFSSAGCTSAWRLSRIATLRESTLLLNQSVTECGYATFYDRLYTVHVANNDLLLPGCNVEAFNECINDNEPAGVFWLTLMRPDDRERLHERDTPMVLGGDSSAIE